MTGGTATLPAAVRAALVSHARREAPRECCGFLLGRNGRVRFAVALANVDRRPKSGYRIDPSQHIALRRWLRQVSPPLEIVGVYHSHPNGPLRPSARDVAEAHYTDWVFAIVALKSDKASLGVFRIGGGRGKMIARYDAAFRRPAQAPGRSGRGWPTQHPPTKS